nr:nuclear transport factor 2 family protein [Polymorphobacter sp.]
MRYVLAVLALAAAAVTAPAAVSAATPAAAADEAAIVGLEKAWRQARIDGDVAFLEKFYAPEFYVQGIDGRRVARADDIGLFARRDVRPEYITPSEMLVTVYGDAAVVTGVDHLRGTYKGHFGEEAYRFTDMLVRRAGTWQLVIQQATSLPTK